MVQIYIDNALYRTFETAEEAATVRAGLRRWLSTSTRVETRPVEEPVAVAPPASCSACRGTGVARRLAWVGSRGGWSWVAGPCGACSEAAAA